jgi:nicotinamidase-related amidase
MYTLVVVDMQPGFLKRFEEYDNTMAKDEVIEGCRRAVVQAIADGAEIIDLNYDSRYGELGTTIPEIQSLWSGYRKLFKKRVVYLEKGRDGGGDVIMENGVAEDEIRVCGINAGACVRDTVWELSNRMIDNQHVVVLADAIANAWNYDCESDIEYMRGFECVDIWE